MNYFISIPMSNYTDEEIRTRIALAKQEIMKIDANATFVNTFIDYAPENATGLWYLGESIKLMSDADAVYMCSGWNYARGCIVEREAALRYDKLVLYQEQE